MNIQAVKEQSHPKLSTLQFIFLIVGAQVKTGILTLPRDLAEVSGTDGWISLLAAWLISLVMGFFIIHTAKKHPDDTLFDLLTRYFGPWIGNLFVLALVGFSFFIVLVVANINVHIFLLFALPHASNYGLMALLLLPLYMVLKNGLNVAGRYNELLFYMLCWMPLFLLVPLKHGHLLNLLPVLKDGWNPVWHGMSTAMFSFYGFELAYLFYPFLANKKAALKGLVIANSITLVTYLFFTFVCYIYFSPDEIKEYKWPPLIELQSIEFSFVERFEVVFLPFFLMVYFTTLIPYLFKSVHGLTRIFHKQDHKPILRVLIVCILLLSIFYSPSYTDLEKYFDWWGYVAIIICFFFPPLFWLYVQTVHLVKKWRGV